MTTTQPRSKAAALELAAVSSHSVTADHFAGKISREECYPRVRATWRGTEVLVELEANRYEHSSGWSEWRIFVRRTDPGTTELAQRALREACLPLVEAWLAGDEYARSRRRAFASYAARYLRDSSSRYSIEALRQMLDRIRPELDP